MDTARDEKEILIAPYGGALINLVTADEGAELKLYAESLPSLALSDRSLYDQKQGLIQFNASKY